jgi:hypothetical protein
MKISGKITQSEFKKEWKGPKGVIFFHNIKVEGFDHLINIDGETKNPSELEVGKQIDLEVNEGDFGWKAKNPSRKKPFNSNRGGGNNFKEKTTSLSELKRMAKGSAVKAAGTVNGIHQKVLIDGAGCNIVAKYVLGNIDSDLPKWDAPETSLMISRQTALHAAADETTARNIQSVEELIQHAENKYKYIIG